MWPALLSLLLACAGSAKDTALVDAAPEDSSHDTGLLDDTGLAQDPLAPL